jgi:hypothetical protein
MLAFPHFHLLFSSSLFNLIRQFLIIPSLSTVAPALGHPLFYYVVAIFHVIPKGFISGEPAVGASVSTIQYDKPSPERDTRCIYFKRGKDANC